MLVTASRRDGRARCSIAYSLRLVELGVPVQVVAPRLGRVAQPDRNAYRRRRIRPAWRARQTHPCFRRRAATLSPVAADAAGDDVLPILAAALRDWNDMVERELSGRQRFVAV